MLLLSGAQYSTGVWIRNETSDLHLANNIESTESTHSLACLRHCRREVEVESVAWNKRERERDSTSPRDIPQTHTAHKLSQRTWSKDVAGACAVKVRRRTSLQRDDSIEQSCSALRSDALDAAPIRCYLQQILCGVARSECEFCIEFAKRYFRLCYLNGKRVTYWIYRFS